MAVGDVIASADQVGTRVLLVGAYARDLCLPQRQRDNLRKTRDADVAVLLEDWGKVDDFLDRCRARFEPDPNELRMVHKATRTPIDVVPCGGLEHPPGRLVLRRSKRVLKPQASASVSPSRTRSPCTAWTSSSRHPRASSC